MIAQTYTTTSEASPITFLVVMAVMLAVSLFYVVCMWRIFERAGEAGWKSLIPIYNTYVLIRICGHPGWWLLLMFLPVISFVVMVILLLDLARAFHRSSAFGVGLVFLWPVFLPILAFGRERTPPRDPRVAAPSLTTNWAAAPAAAPGPAATPAWAAPAGPPVAGVPAPAGPGGWIAGPQSPALPPPVDLPAELTAPGAAAAAAEPAPAAPVDPAEPPPVAHAEPAPEVPAGWYDDPDLPGWQRWWDGTAWTDQWN